jgi:hypothetical protein
VIPTAEAKDSYTEEGPLDDAESVLMRQHPAIGARIVAGLDLLRDAARSSSTTRSAGTAATPPSPATTPTA